MAFERTGQPSVPKAYQGKKKQRWPTRIVIALVSVAGMLGLWQFIAHEPPVSSHSTPSFQDAEQELQLGAPNNGATHTFNASPPNIYSGLS